MPRRPAREGVQWYVAMDSVNAMIGAFLATEEIGTGSKYMRSNINAAFNYANKEFERETIAKAMTTKKYAHMFEWGTVGINTAPTNMRPQPTQDNAKLWKPIATDTLNGIVVSFTYLPSKAIVPKPTMKKTGIPSSITKKLSDHVFWNKAKVMESGQKVKVARINAKALFIPLAYQGQKGFKMLAGPTAPTPGESKYHRTHKGTFTLAWNAFWETRGTQMMDARVEEYVRQDLDTIIRKINAMPAGRWSPPNKVNMQGKIERSKRTTLKLLNSAAEGREIANGE